MSKYSKIEKKIDNKTSLNNFNNSNMSNYTLIRNNNEKTILQNQVGRMEVIDNREYIYMKNESNKGNCMRRTAERFDYLVRKYGVNNFGLMSLCFTKIKNDKKKYIQHVVIYNKKQDKVIDCSNGIIALLDSKTYRDRVFENTINNLYTIYYVNKSPLTITRHKNNNMNKKMILNDNVISKIDNDMFQEMICSIISYLWRESKDKILNEGTKYQ